MTIDVDSVRQHIEKLLHQLVSIKPEDIDIVERLCKTLYIPFHYAQQEAESFSSFLCKTGQVDAVVTEDTDVLAYGCPMWLSSINHDGWCTEVNFNDMLTALSMTNMQFIDLCILCGTDYNESLPGIGPVKAYKALQTYGSVSHYLKNQTQPSECLRYDIVLNILTHPCEYAIIHKTQPDIKPIHILFNPLIDNKTIINLKQDAFPTQVLLEWFKCYDSKFILEK